MTAALIEEMLDWDGRIVLQNGSGEVLDQNYEWKKAIRLLVLEKAVLIAGEFVKPQILRLKEYIYIAYEKLHGPPRVSKRNILLRDKRVCSYKIHGVDCDRPATTIDHVHPRTLGGKNLWQNMVAACSKCNHRKGQRTLEEIREKYGMELRFKPYIPKRSDLR